MTDVSPRTIQAVEAELVRLQRECDALQAELQGAKIFWEHAHTRADQAERENERLRIALRLYAKHIDGCPVPDRCLCGLWNLQYPDKNAATDEQEG